MVPDRDEPPLEGIVSGAVTALTFLVGFGLLAAGVSSFWIAFPVGFGGVLPLAMGLVRYYQENDGGAGDPATEDPLETLRQRYARGELTEDQFEERVERLLETESVADATTDIERARGTESESQLRE